MQDINGNSPSDYRDEDHCKALIDFALEEATG